MAVTKVIRRWEGRQGSTDENGVRVLDEEFLVETNSDADGVPTVVAGVIATFSWAALYQPHPDWPRAVCRLINARPNGGPRVWLVPAKFSSAPFAANGDGGASGVEGAGAATTPAEAAQGQDTPADQRPPTLSVTEREIVRPHVVDVTGDPHVNTVGDQFDPPEEVPHNYHVFTWRFFRKPSELAWDQRSLFLDSVNSDLVNVLGRIYQPGTLRCKSYQSETVWETGASGLELFYQLTVIAEEDPEGYAVSTLNTGRRWIGVSDTVPPVITDGNGQPVADPVPLDEDGVPVGDPADYHYVESLAYELRAWNGTGSGLFATGGLLA